MEVDREREIKSERVRETAQLVGVCSSSTSALVALVVCFGLQRKKKKPQLELLHKQNWIEVLQLSGRENLQQMAKIRTAECPNPVNRYSPPTSAAIGFTATMQILTSSPSISDSLPSIFILCVFFASAAKRIAKKLV